jgi:hypothetical protein
MKFKVYHDIHPSFGRNQAPAFNAVNYEKVADLDITGRKRCDIEEAYVDTNHITCDWTTNKSVVWHKADKLRSTSVGDVIVDESGDGFLCEPTGWTNLGKVQVF